MTMRRTPARRRRADRARRLGPDRVVEHEGARPAPRRRRRRRWWRPRGSTRRRTSRAQAGSGARRWRTRRCRRRPRGRPRARGCRRPGSPRRPRGARARRRARGRRTRSTPRGRAATPAPASRAAAAPRRASGRRRRDVGEVWPAGGEGAGLVEQQHACPGERLERAAALDDDAPPRRSGRCRRRSRWAPRAAAGRASPRRAPRARAPGRPTITQATPAMTSVRGTNSRA